MTKTDIRTSETHPIGVDFVAARDLPARGRLGLTFAPGKHAPGLHGLWRRDLATDLARLRDVHAMTGLVCLLEDDELVRLDIASYEAAVSRLGDVALRRLPIPDGGVPADPEALQTLVAWIVARLRAGATVVVHCRGGLGRAGLVSACVLRALGLAPDEAMARVRAARRGAIENRAQEDFVRAFVPAADATDDPAADATDDATTRAPAAFAEVAAFVRAREVGRACTITTPFGQRLICYADLTATGRYLDFVERWVRTVRGYYANTHTAVSSTGALMTRLREDARAVIARAVNAGPDDQVLFCGSGATAAAHKLVGLIGLRIAEPLEREHHLARHIPIERRPVVFIGPYEHHSNELPWRETVADVVVIDLTADGVIDLGDLERQLVAYADRSLRIGSFSAASNVTGLLSDVPAIARLLHAHGAWAVFDYAAAGPYVPIDMHPADPAARVDALMLSVHKLMGGPQASGVLVAHSDLFRTRVPERPGGGTVAYVSALGEPDYSEDLEEREEGGTPAIIGDIRAGAAFLVKQMLSPPAILAHEVAIARRALARLSAHPNIRILGSTTHDRLAILSFNVVGLHHDLVSALLDHLFGIQNRAGCACAGPYGHRLLGVDVDRSERLRALIARGLLAMKPGWVRVTLPYYASADDLDFILGAIELIAEHGHTFAPCYRLDWRDGVWRHALHPVVTPPPIELTLDALIAAARADDAPEPEPALSEASLASERARYRAEALALADVLAARWRLHPPTWNRPTGDAEVDALIWFRYVASDGLPDVATG